MFSVFYATFIAYPKTNEYFHNFIKVIFLFVTNFPTLELISILSTTEKQVLRNELKKLFS